MSQAAGRRAPRVLVVGDDADLCAALHPALARAGHAVWCAPAPGELEALLRVAAPELLLLVLPATPDASWGAALSAGAGAARVGVRVVLVAPAADVVEPLAVVAGAERALARADVLARPLLVLERRREAAAAAADAPAASRPSAGPAARDPAPPPPRATAPATTAAAAAPPQLATLAELEEDRRAAPPPHRSRVEVNVSLVSEHNFFVGATRRVDSGGVFISTASPPPVGTALQLRLGLADGRKLDVDGEVTFLRPRSGLGGRQPSGCGVRLSALPGWALEAIERFQQARPPIVWVAGR